MQVGPTLGQRERLTTGGQRAGAGDPSFPCFFSGLSVLICNMGVRITAATNCWHCIKTCVCTASLAFPEALWGDFSWHPCLTEEQIEPQRGEVPCSSSCLSMTAWNSISGFSMLLIPVSSLPAFMGHLKQCQAQ